MYKRCLVLLLAAALLSGCSSGLIADFAGGTIDGLASPASDPAAAIEGINSILTYPGETLPVIGGEIKTWFEDNVVNGSGEDRAAVAGQATGEILSWLIGVGEAKAGIRIASYGDEFGRLAGKFDELSDAARIATKVSNTTLWLREQ